MKKSTLVFLAVIFLVLGGAGGYFITSKRRLQTTSPAPDLASETKTKADLIYKDESGFSFAYPSGFKVSDVTPESEEYYSQLKVSRKEEFLLISVKDGQVPAYDNADLVGAVALAGMPAKQYARAGKLITVAGDRGVVYLIEGLKDGGKWEEIQNLVVSSFALTEEVVGGAADENVIYEEEEVIE